MLKQLFIFCLFATVVIAGGTISPGGGTLAGGGSGSGSGGSATNALIQGPAGIYDASLVTNVVVSAVNASSIQSIANVNYSGLGLYNNLIVSGSSAISYSNTDVRVTKNLFVSGFPVVTNFAPFGSSAEVIENNNNTSFDYSGLMGEQIYHHTGDNFDYLVIGYDDSSNSSKAGQLAIIGSATLQNGNLCGFHVIDLNDPSADKRSFVIRVKCANPGSAGGYTLLENKLITSSPLYNDGFTQAYANWLLCDEFGRVSLGELGQASDVAGTALHSPFEVTVYGSYIGGYPAFGFGNTGGTYNMGTATNGAIGYNGSKFFLAPGLAWYQIITVNDLTNGTANFVGNGSGITGVFLLSSNNTVGGTNTFTGPNSFTQPVQAGTLKVTNSIVSPWTNALLGSDGNGNLRPITNFSGVTFDGTNLVVTGGGGGGTQSILGHATTANRSSGTNEMSLEGNVKGGGNWSYRTLWNTSCTFSNCEFSIDTSGNFGLGTNIIWYPIWTNGVPVTSFIVNINTAAVGVMWTNTGTQSYTYTPPPGSTNGISCGIVITPGIANCGMNWHLRYQ